MTQSPAAAGWSSAAVPIVMLVVFVALIVVLVVVIRRILIRIARIYRAKADAELGQGEARRRREIEESGWDPKKRA